MSVMTSGPDERLFTNRTQRRQALEVLQQAEDGPHTERFELKCLEHDSSAELPPELSAILAKVVEIVAQGGTLTIGSLPEDLTTTVAAEQLGISRPTLMKMIREGEIRAHKAGSHTRLKTKDVLAFKRARLERQRKAFDELRTLEEELDQS